MEGWNMSPHKLSSRCSIIVSLGRPSWDLHKAAVGKGSSRVEDLTSDLMEMDLE